MTQRRHRVFLPQQKVRLRSEDARSNCTWRAVGTNFDKKFPTGRPERGADTVRPGEPWDGSGVEESSSRPSSGHSRFEEPSSRSESHH